VQWERAAAATAGQLSELQSAEAGLAGQLQQLGSQVGQLTSGASATVGAVESLQQQVQVSTCPGWRAGYKSALRQHVLPQDTGSADVWRQTIRQIAAWRAKYTLAIGICCCCSSQCWSLCLLLAVAVVVEPGCREPSSASD
jgi:hypothetical protein